MLLVTQTRELSARYGDCEAIRMLAEAGYDALDYSMFCMTEASGSRLLSDGWREEMTELRALAESLGVPFVQGHAPHTFSDHSEEAWRGENFPRLLRSIEIAGALGIENLVIHPIHHLDYRKNRELLHEWNMRFYRRLLPYAKDAGVRICLENMWQRDRRRGNIISDDTCSAAEELAAWVDELNDPSFGVCLDIGHCGLVGRDAEESVSTLGGRLTVLHVHDNDFVSDDHTLPYLGKADWDAILAALAGVGYRGNLTFEADRFLTHIPDALIPAALRFMVATGRHMIEKIEANRTLPPTP